MTRTQTTRKNAKTNWARLRRMSDGQVRRALKSERDIRPTDDAFWNKAKVVMPRRKEVVTMRLDADLLGWLRRERGYQTRVNAVLRAYMKAQENSAGKPLRN